MLVAPHLHDSLDGQVPLAGLVTSRRLLSPIQGHLVRGPHDDAHQGRRQLPNHAGMAAGVADPVWSLTEIAALLESPYSATRSSVGPPRLNSEVHG